MSFGKVVLGIVVVAAAGIFVGYLLAGPEDERMVDVSAGRAAKLDAKAGSQVVVDDRGAKIPDSQVKRAVAAALAATGGGVATEIERSDDPGEAYEVEVVRDGVEIDVALDEQLRRVRNERFEK